MQGRTPDLRAITYGPVTDYRRFNCHIISAQNTSVSGRVICSTSHGWGANLLFAIYTCSSDGQNCLWFNSSVALVNFTLSYPVPTITPSTLRFPFGEGSASRAATSTAAQTVLFDGIDFYPTQMMIFFGPSSAPAAFTCAIDIAISTSSIIQCITEAGASGVTTFLVVSFRCPYSLVSIFHSNPCSTNMNVKQLGDE
jgi:hypothetical protein